MDLSPVGEELYNMINKDHVLAKYIVAFDNHLDNDSILRSIGERIGIFIPEDEYAPFVLYIKLKEFLTKENNPDLTRKIIDMSPDEYEKYLISVSPNNKNLSREEFYPIYANRLLN